MCYLLSKEISAFASIPRPPHIYSDDSLDDDLQTETCGGGRYRYRKGISTLARVVPNLLVLMA
jgi:hypothetical protein